MHANRPLRDLLFFVGFLSVAGFFQQLAWLCDLCVHFRVQYVGILLFLGVYFFLFRHWHLLILAVGLLVLNGADLAPAFQKPPQKAPFIPQSQKSEVIRIVYANVSSANKHPEKILEWIRQLQPDLIALVEINEFWHDALKDSLQAYQFIGDTPRVGAFGMGIYSRRPFKEARLEFIGKTGIPSVFAQLLTAAGDKPVSFVLTHAYPPVTPISLKQRNQQLQHLALFRNQLPGTFVALGDFNTTPWSKPFRELLRDAKLQDSRLGFGLQASWPTVFPPLLIPIDHCLTSPDVRVLLRKIGPPTGSDHYPVYLELLI